MTRKIKDARLTIRDLFDKFNRAMGNGSPVIKGDMVSVPMIVFIHESRGVQSDEGMISNDKL